MFHNHIIIYFKKIENILFIIIYYYLLIKQHFEIKTMQKPKQKRNTKKQKAFTFATNLINTCDSGKHSILALVMYRGDRSFFATNAKKLYKQMEKWDMKTIIARNNVRDVLPMCSNYERRKAEELVKKLEYIGLFIYDLWAKSHTAFIKNRF